MGIQERKEREKERRRQQIIVAAKRVFSIKGLSKTTMEDIAKESELSPGTLYLYFKNKEELYASLSLRILQFLSIRVAQVIQADATSPPERLDNLITAMYEVYEFDPMVIINMFHLQSSETLRNLSPALLQEINTLSKKALDHMASIFRDGMEQGYFIACHPIALADIFWSLFSGVILWEASKKVIDPDKDHLKSTLATAFELFCRGIRK